MSDEGFHLTPIDIRRYDFGSALRGYDKARVDQFRDQVAAEVERLIRLNQDLDQKTKGLVEQLRAFRERDKALNDALVSAQQLRAEIREQADREAQLLMREARSQVERDVDGIRAEARKLEDEIQGLVKVRRVYLSQLRTMVERQLAEIESAESTPMPAPPMMTNTSPAPSQSQRRDEPKQTAHPTPAWLDSLVKE
ncbi:MAG TPA: DivIVA domain-containing protein [Gemmatimonadaceae bacterium]|nr:DivIVA domain-containing protein [Gemmatimonadaceae bacterium]